MFKGKWNKKNNMWRAKANDWWGSHSLLSFQSMRSWWESGRGWGLRLGLGSPSSVPVSAEIVLTARSALPRRRRRAAVRFGLGIWKWWFKLKYVLCQFMPIKLPLIFDSDTLQTVLEFCSTFIIFFYQHQLCESFKPKCLNRKMTFNKQFSLTCLLAPVQSANTDNKQKVSQSRMWIITGSDGRRIVFVCGCVPTLGRDFERRVDLPWRLLTNIDGGSFQAGEGQIRENSAEKQNC